MPPPPPPAIPRNLRLDRKGSHSLSVRWDSVAGANFYELEVAWAGTSARVFRASSPQKIEALLSAASISIFSNRVYVTRIRAVKLFDGGSRVQSAWSPPLRAATLPPKPSAPSASNSMIEVDIKLSWDVQLPNNVDTTHPLLVEINREDSAAPIGTALPLLGTFADTPSLGENNYSIRLYSDISGVSPSRNASEWSDKLQVRKDVFAKLEIPGTQMNQKLRMELMRRNYGYP